MTDESSLLPALRDPLVMATQALLVKRSCPGFLAIAVEGAPIRFAVEGATEEEARANFAAARERWAILRAMP